MKKILTAIALTIAVPAVAFAQAAPAPAAKADCCEKMKDKAGCKDMGMAGMAGMAGMSHGAMKGGETMPADHAMMMQPSAETAKAAPPQTSKQ